MRKALGLVICLFACSFSKLDAAKLNVGIVDIQQVLFYYDEYKILRIEMAQKESRYEAEIEQEKLELDELKRKMTQDKITEEERNRLDKDYARRMFNLQRKFEGYKKSLDDQKQEAMEKIHESIMSEIKKLSAEKKFDYVFEKKSLYFGESVEVTEDLIKGLNKKSGGAAPVPSVPSKKKKN